MSGHLFNTNKLKYAMKKKPVDKCILCSIVNQLEKVDSLEIYRTDKFVISVNLYPFNTGHLMIFPIRHIEHIEDLTESEALQLHKLTILAVKILKSEYKPHGFNIGYNLENAAGASIRHIHQHIVPRYENETGFLDVLSGTKVVIIDPVEVRNHLTCKFKEFEELKESNFLND
jgi:ATP adenylyltransferase